VNGNAEVMRRLAMLEIAQRRLKRGVAIASLLGGCLVLLASRLPQSRRIEAEAFILRDASSNMRAALITDSASGAAGLWVYDAKKLASGVFAAGNDQIPVILEMRDETRTDRFSMMSPAVVIPLRLRRMSVPSPMVGSRGICLGTKRPLQRGGGAQGSV